MRLGVIRRMPTCGGVKSSRKEYRRGRGAWVTQRLLGQESAPRTFHQGNAPRQQKTHPGADRCALAAKGMEKSANGESEETAQKKKSTKEIRKKLRRELGTKQERRGLAGWSTKTQQVNHGGERLGQRKGEEHTHNGAGLW